MDEALRVTDSRPKFRLKSVALPNEHGAWGLLFEPIAASLAIAFSVGGIWIAVMTVGAFLSRQPVKVFVLNRLGRRDPELSAAAVKFGSLYGAIFAMGFGGTLATVGFSPLLPFVFIMPLLAAQIYYDSFRQGRKLLPELAGAISISASAAAIALAGGFHIISAFGIWLIFIARLVPSIIYVRERLKLEKGKAYSRVLPLSAQASGLAIVAFLALFRIVPILPVFAMSLLSLRSIEGLASTRKKMRAMQIGVWEVVFGVITSLSLIVGYHLGV